MDSNFQGESEPGLISGIRREVGKIEGEFRNIERSHEQREADKYENRAERYAAKEAEDFSQGRYP
ncbi:hypothetical protein I4U23_016012 [Adineta vaga]|nr:hypothetical protein I4U23_016012 [Adineta vaga]